jgi:PAS domain S-box-containing protein
MGVPGSTSQPMIDTRADPRARRSGIDLRYVLIVGGGLLFLLVFAFAVWDAWYLRSQSETRASNNLSNLARALASQTMSTLSSVDSALRDDGDLAARRLMRPQQPVHGAMPDQRSASLPWVHDVVVFDAHGTPHSWPGGSQGSTTLANVRNALDQPYFKVHRDHPDFGLSITPLSSNASAIVVSRRLSDVTSGEFAGVVAGLLDQTSFDAAYRSLELGAGGAVLLLRRDGVLLAGYPDRGTPLSTTFSDSRAWHEVVAGGAATVSELNNPFDGAASLVAFEPVHGFPVMVSVVMDKQFALRGWRQQTWHITARTLILASVVAALLVILLRELELREQSQRRLRQCEERYALAMAGSNEGHWDWDLDSGLLYVSARLQSILRTGERDEVIDRKLFERKLQVHPADVARVRQTQQVHLRGATPYYQCEYRARYGSGEYRWFLVRGLALRGANGRPYRMSGSTSDVTDRKQAEEGLRVQTALLDELFESAPEGIVMLDERHCVMRANREFARIFGYTVAEMQGRSLIELIVPDELVEQTHTLFLQTLQGQSVIAETVRARKDGSRVDVSILGAPIHVADRRIGTFVIVRDIMERKQLEAERGRLEQRLRQAEKLEAIGTMAGGIAHDFNNILGAILGYGSMALNAAPEGSSLKRYVANIKTAADRAKLVIDQILTFSRSQRGKRTVVCVSLAVEETLEMVRASLPGAIELVLADRTQSAMVICDPTHIHQMMMNLCTNAIHAMHQGGRLDIELDALEATAELRLSHGLLPPGRYVCLSVRDTGEGMTTSMLERIFEPFFTTKAPGSGTGLGLALVHAVVSDLGGAVHVRSEAGAGSCFDIYLPRADAKKEQSAIGSRSIPWGNGARILLVEDEKPLMLLAEEMVAGLGYDVAGFSSPHAALEAFAADPRAFDVVITDQLMPLMTGTELARRLREFRSDIGVILISGYRGPLLAQEALGAGIQELVMKPLSARDLAQALARTVAASAGPVRVCVDAVACSGTVGSDADQSGASRAPASSSTLSST